MEKAYRFAEEAHAGQKRKSGEPYFTHPCFVAVSYTHLDVYKRQHPARELCRLDGNCYGTSGNVLVNQPYPSFP